MKLDVSRSLSCLPVLSRDHSTVYHESSSMRELFCLSSPSLSIQYFELVTLFTHDWFSRYHFTVFSRPDWKVSAGSHPVFFRNFSEFMAYLMSCPGLSGTKLIISV